MQTSPRSGERPAPGRHPEFDAALRFDAQGAHDAAVQALRRAAAAGDVEATTFLASRLLVGRAAPLAPREALPLMVRAARAGGAEANLCMANLEALGEGMPQSWPGAIRSLRRAAELGSARARAQLRFLAGADAADDRGASWAALARAVDLSAWLRPVAGDELSGDPQLRAARGFIDARTCRWLIERAAPLRRPATIVELATGRTRTDPRRSNTGASFDLLSLDLVVLLVQARLSLALGAPVGHFEQPQVLHYDPGQTFALHHDCLGHGAGGAGGGQRVTTALIYLNDGYEGGETEFPRLGLRHRGAPGDAFWFSNVDGAGRPHPLVHHAGLPPTAGEKWVFSQWVRDRGPGEVRPA